MAQDGPTCPYMSLEAPLKDPLFPISPGRLPFLPPAATGLALLHFRAVVQKQGLALSPCEFALVRRRRGTPQEVQTGKLLTYDKEICTYTYTRICMRCMYVCLHACIYVCMHVCMYVFMCVCLSIYTYVCMYVRNSTD